jgi:phenylacetate-CoA ligase
VAAGRALHATRVLPSLFSGDLLRVTSVPVTRPVPEIVERLNALQPPLLQAYPSMLSVLAAEQAAGRLRIAPRMITGSSEQFPAEAKQRVAAAFGVPPVDQFGSSEGVLGVSAPGEPVISLASDLAIVELVDEQGRPVPPGTPSAKVLVTNLMNPAQPLIRYELEDRFVAQPGTSGHLRVTVEGRSDDVLRWPGVTVHPLVLRSALVATPAVVEYQVRQTADGVDVTVVPDGPLDRAALAARLAAALEGAGLAGAVVSVGTAAAIPADPRTGKAKRFLPRRTP